jgi:4-phytase/acid phosphatase
LAARLLATLLAGAGLPYRHERIGGPSDVIVIAGHDGTLSQLGGLLDIDWVVPGYQQNQVVPGGGLVFEVWRRAADRRVVLRLRYVTQSLKQLRECRPLTAAQPPLSAPIFIPGCSESTAAFDCPLDLLAALLDGPISSHGNSSMRFLSR